LLHREFDRIPCHLSSWQNPSLPKGFQNVGVELTVAYQRADHLSVFASEGFHLGAHLQPDALDGAVGRGEARLWANDRKEGVHEYSAFVWPTPVDRRFSNAGLCRNRLDAEISKADLKGEVKRRSKDDLMNLFASRPSSATA
jgi:hypothetical protein